MPPTKHQNEPQPAIPKSHRPAKATSVATCSCSALPTGARLESLSPQSVTCTCLQYIPHGSRLEHFPAKGSKRPGGRQNKLFKHRAAALNRQLLPRRSGLCWPLKGLPRGSHLDSLECMSRGHGSPKPPKDQARQRHPGQPASQHMQLHGSAPCFFKAMVLLMPQEEQFDFWKHELSSCTVRPCGEHSYLGQKFPC